MTTTTNAELKRVAEVELHYKTSVKPSDRIAIKSSQDAYDLLKQLFNEETVELKEDFKVILLNRANKVLGYYNLSNGGVAGTVADPKLIFAAGLRAMASGLILAHNHPSGSLTPSAQDIELTKKLKEGGKLLEIQVLDHIIYTVETYFSFADDGLM